MKSTDAPKIDEDISSSVTEDMVGESCSSSSSSILGNNSEAHDDPVEYDIDHSLSLKDHVSATNKTAKEQPLYNLESIPSSISIANSEQETISPIMPAAAVSENDNKNNEPRDSIMVDSTNNSNTSWWTMDPQEEKQLVKKIESSAPKKVCKKEPWWSMNPKDEEELKRKMDFKRSQRVRNSLIGYWEVRTKVRSERKNNGKMIQKLIPPSFDVLQMDRKNSRASTASLSDSCSTRETSSWTLSSLSESCSFSSSSRASKRVRFKGLGDDVWIAGR